MMTKEQIVDRISELLIENYNEIYTEQELSLENFQKVVRNGVITYGRNDPSEKLIVYKEDTLANREDTDLITYIYDTQFLSGNEFGTSEDAGLSPDQITLFIEGDMTIPMLVIGTYQLDISDLYNSGAIGNEIIFSDNVSQFVNFEDEQKIIDPTKAKEVLDTTIYELLPSNLTRQQRINNFFKEYNVLKGLYPNFSDTDADGYPEPYDSFNNPYDSWHDISWIQDNPNWPSIIEEESFITRLEQNENQNNTGQSLQWLRNDINLFLEDADTSTPEGGLAIEDERPLYENKSEGYLKLRDLNQSIIVRNPEGRDIGLEQEITVWRTRTDGSQIEFTGPRWQAKGFSIGMWVRFKDRVNSGTLFNYGNPLRAKNPYGFMLDTFVINKDDPVRDKDSDNFVLENPETWGELVENDGAFSNNHTYFQYNNYERFIRLVVRDENMNIMDSHVGKEKRRGRVSYSREATITHKWDGTPIISTDEDLLPELGIPGGDESQYQQYPFIISNFKVPGVPQEDDNNNWYPNKLLLHKRIPVDYDEWYYIVATYNPNIWEWESFHENIYESAGPNGKTAIRYYPEFWTNNVVPVNQLPPVGYIQNCQDYPLVFPLEPTSCDSETYCAGDDVEERCKAIGTYTHNSGYGAKCKVEVIPRSQLLRAKGFRTT